MKNDLEWTMSRLKIKLEKNRTIKSPVIDVTSDYKKIIRHNICNVELQPNICDI